MLCLLGHPTLYIVISCLFVSLLGCLQMMCFVCCFFFRYLCSQVYSLWILHLPGLAELHLFKRDCLKLSFQVIKNNWPYFHDLLLTHTLPFSPPLSLPPSFSLPHSSPSLRNRVSWSLEDESTWQKIDRDRKVSSIPSMHPLPSTHRKPDACRMYLIPRHRCMCVTSHPGTETHVRCNLTPRQKCM